MNGCNAKKAVIIFYNQPHVSKNKKWYRLKVLPLLCYKQCDVFYKTHTVYVFVKYITKNIACRNVKKGAKYG
jgi:hypothetical protein